MIRLKLWVFLFILTCPFFSISAQILQEELWVTNGPVGAIVPDDSRNLIYIGGSFSYVGPATGHAAPVDVITGETLTGFPKVNGLVRVIIPDVSGGWYIGGNFTRVGDFERNNIAHINPDFTVNSAWDPNASGGFSPAVYDLVLADDLLYVAGGFEHIGGETRKRLVALDLTTGNATEWDPDIRNGLVHTIAVADEMVYAGGTFSEVGDSLRSRLVAVDKITGQAADWNPSPSVAIQTMAISDGILYVGGGFTAIAGEPRGRIAAFDISTNTLTDWNAGGTAGIVYAIEISGDTLYAGGSFTNLGGQSRNRIAALDLTANTNNALSWNPGSSHAIFDLQVVGDLIYAGGQFASIGGAFRSRVASLYRTIDTNNATDWNPHAIHNVEAVAIAGSVAYVGGNFTSIGGKTRQRIAAVDAMTGKVTDWNPGTTGIIYDMEITNDILYVVGTFTQIADSTRGNIASFDLSTGDITDWDPNANNDINSISVSGDTVFIGGLFSEVGGQPRTLIAALDATVNTNNALDWNPGGSWSGIGIASVNVLTATGNVVYAGGVFDEIGGAPRNRIGALDRFTDTNNATDWNPNANGHVYAIYVVDDIVYVGGEFNNIGGAARGRIAALDATVNTDNATDWNPDANGTVNAITLTEDLLYAGGLFTNIGGQPRNRIAALHTTVNSNNATEWDPDASGGSFPTVDVLAKSLKHAKIYSGGNYEELSGDYGRRFFGAVDNPNDFSLTLPPDAVVLQSPEDNETNVVLTPVLSWEPAPRTNEYQLQLAGDSDFSNIVISASGLPNTEYTVDEPLDYGTEYFWRVRASNTAGAGDWSDIRSFTTIIEAPGAPLLVAPADGELSVPRDVDLVWHSVGNADSYHLQFSQMMDFSTTLVDSTGIPDTTFSLSNLDYNTEYFWRVSAANAGGTSDWSAAWSFTTIEPPPGVPLLSFPPNDTTGVATSLRLQWQETDGAMSYRLQLSDEDGFESTLIDSSGIEVTQLHVDNLQNATTYYWRVNAMGVSGDSDWSDVWKFTTIIAAPGVVDLISPEDSLVVSSTSLQFIWHSGEPEIDRYYFELSTDSDFTSLVVDSTLSDTTLAFNDLMDDQSYWWRVKAENVAGEGPYSEIRTFHVVLTSVLSDLGVPEEFKLYQNYPNPFNPSTVIRYGLPERSYVEIIIYNIIGQKVISLVQEELDAGYHEVTFDASYLPSGIYIYRLQAGDFVESKRLMLIK